MYLTYLEKYLCSETVYHFLDKNVTLKVLKVIL